MITVEQAQIDGICRVCGERYDSIYAPQDFHLDFGEQVFPTKWTFNFGREFAHTDCLEAETRP